MEAPDATAMTFLRSSRTSHTLVGESGEEIQGPFSLGVYAERYGADSTSRIVVFSSDYFMYSDINQAVNGTNYDLFMKALAKVSMVDDVTDIPVKSYSYNPVLVGNGARGFFSVVLIGVLPAVLLISGIVIWHRRRHG